ncbi:hypothetical protein [Sulfurimonas sp.]|uniref:hypothetical protein n=1 Tax=Sulfurimonas sp. TaxID=2022749 RepID=UPI00356AC3AD
MNALLLELHTADDELDSSNIHHILADIKKSCHTSEQRRNQLVHSKWAYSFKNAPDLMLRIKDSATSKKGYSYSIEDMNTSQLEEDIEFINKTTERVHKLRNDLSLKFRRTHGLDGLSNIFTHKSLTNFINDSFLEKHNANNDLHNKTQEPI